jgi:hypothetical protein
MSFFEDQEDDWFANDCKGAPSDYYAGELAPWCDGFTNTSTPTKPRTEAQKARKKRNRARRRAKELVAAKGKQAQP